MAARKKKVSPAINLLPKEEFAASTWGRVLKWLLSTFRVIVVVIEVVVMGAFLSRFWLDARSADLNDQIRQRQGTIESFVNFEKRFREIQAKIEIFAATTPQERQALPKIEVVTSLMPADVILDSVILMSDSIQLRAIAFTEESIAQYLVNLGASGEFEKVELQEASTGDDNSITFNIKVTLLEEN